MAELIPSEPTDNDDGLGDGDRANAHARSRRPKVNVPSADECLAALGRLPGAVAMKFITPAQASAMRASYAEILRHHQKCETRSERKAIADEDVIELMRNDSKAFSIMEPFLTDEQVDMVLRGAKDGGDGQA